MFIVWGVICKLKLDFLVDSGAKGKVTGPFTEFAAVLPGGYRCPIPPEVRPNKRNRTDQA